MANLQPPGRMQTEITIAEEQAEAVAVIEQIDYLLLEESGDRYRWAEDTLMGIRDTIVRTQRVSAQQRRAVHNIEDAGNKDR